MNSDKDWDGYSTYLQLDHDFHYKKNLEWRLNLATKNFSCNLRPNRDRIVTEIHMWVGLNKLTDFVTDLVTKYLSSQNIGRKGSRFQSQNRILRRKKSQRL
jgi:hypothetical protein